jgi:hypothetical protein
LKLKQINNKIGIHAMKEAEVNNICDGKNKQMEASM